MREYTHESMTKHLLPHLYLNEQRADKLRALRVRVRVSGLAVRGGYKRGVAGPTMRYYGGQIQKV